MGLFDFPKAASYLDAEEPVDKKPVDKKDGEDTRNNSEKNWRVEITTEYNPSEAPNRKYTASAKIYDNHKYPTHSIDYQYFEHTLSRSGPSPEVAIANVEKALAIWVADRKILDAVPKKKTLFF